jgi:hypothetical protein
MPHRYRQKNNAGNPMLLVMPVYMVILTAKLPVASLSMTAPEK